MVKSTTAAETPGSTRRPDGAGVLDLFRRTDYGNSQRLVGQHAESVRFVTDLQSWMVWDAGRWVADPDQAAMTRRAVETVKSMYQAAGDEDARGARRAVAEWAMRSESLPRLRAAVTLSQAHEQVRVRVSELDSDPLLLGVQNGVLDLRSGQLVEARPEDLITHQSPVEFDPEAECPLWERTLARLLPDREMREFLQRAVGYSLTGSTDEQVMFVAYGRGANGKSVAVETISTLLGGYAQKGPADLLMSRNTDSALSNDVARLRGARFVAVVETEEGRRLAESRVKELTGGDTVTARFLHKEFFEFKPVAKLWLVTNHKPRISGTDDGIWRRLLLLPFGEYIGPEERDKRLAEKLRAELPGILNWALAGCRQWQRDGLMVPAAGRAAAAAYRAEQDVLGAFLTERCVSREGAVATAAELYRAYQQWCQDNGHVPSSQTMFGTRLSERGYERFRTKSGHRWRGIGLRNDGFEGPDGGSDGPGDGGGTEPPEPAPGGSGGSLTDYRPCLECGEPCHPFNESGKHPGCEGDSSPSESAPVQPEQEAIAEREPEDQVQPEPEPEDQVQPVTVTRRSKRPWSRRSTVYLLWSTGRGVDDAGNTVEVPKRAPLARFLDALPLETQRVVLIGAMPGGSGPGLQDWATSDVPEGWEAGTHYLDPESLAARYARPDGGKVEVHRLESWTRATTGSTPKPERVAAAFDLLRRGLGATFDPPRVKPGQAPEPTDPDLAPAILSSPSSTGRELLLRSLPYGHDYPVLDPEHLDLLHHTTGQGRNELLTEHHGEQLPGLYGYDMRWSYAGLCRGVRGSGPAQVDQGSEFLGYAPARYEVEFTVPEGWQHLGLLPVAGRGWPNEPGSKWVTWADARELRLADRWGWRIEDMQIKRRLIFTDTKSEPLRTWAEKLVDLRERWLPAQEGEPEAVVKLARDFARTILLAGLGALQGRRQRLTHSVPRERAGEVPEGVDAHLAGNRLVWTAEAQAVWREMVHPEWVSQVWAEQRCRLLDSGPKAAQANVGALHLPYGDLVALRTDAVYSTTDPGWVDGGRVGQFRSQMACSEPVETPRSVEDLLRLRGE